MRRGLIAICCMLALASCDKHDPILPGVRTAVFNTSRIDVKNQTISDIPESAFVVDNSGCSYTQDSSNVIWDGTRKVFSGFPTNNTVASKMYPVCSGGYIYAGLTTGELVKLNPKNRQIAWIADIYRASNLTGGASMVDIVVPPVPYRGSVYVGGLGDAFCRVNAATGNKVWCLEISVGVPFIVAGNYSFVLGTDNNLYAIKLSDGTVVWRAEMSQQNALKYEAGVVSVGRDRVDITTGKIIL